MQNETPQAPLRLVGICKNCHRAAHGFLAGGVGPFICYECSKRIRTSSQDSTTGVWSFSFTTSNSSTTNSNDYFTIGGS